MIWKWIQFIRRQLEHITYLLLIMKFLYYKLGFYGISNVDWRTIAYEFKCSLLVYGLAFVFLNIKKSGWLLTIFLILFAVNGGFEFISIPFVGGLGICFLNHYGYLDKLRKPKTRSRYVIMIIIKFVALNITYFSLVSRNAQTNIEAFGFSSLKLNFSLSRDLLGPVFLIFIADISPFLQRLLELNPLPFLGFTF